MITRNVQRLIFIGVVCLIVVTAVGALAATNSIPGTHLGETTDAIDANELKPAECAALNLTAVTTCPAAGGTCDGTDDNELILGSPNADNITGGKGMDCILGGGGDDFLKGDQGNDVCIGGPGNDSFHTSCRIQIQ